MLTELQYRLLRRISPTEPSYLTGEAYRNRSKLAVLLGETLLREVEGRNVTAFGCGEGEEAPELARNGARVYGLDIKDALLERARQRRRDVGLSEERCRFGRAPTEPADIIVAL